MYTQANALLKCVKNHRMQLHSHLDKVEPKMRSNFYRVDKEFCSIKSTNSVLNVRKLSIIHLPKVNKEIIFCVQKASERSERVNFLNRCVSVVKRDRNNKSVLFAFKTNNKMKCIIRPEVTNKRLFAFYKMHFLKL